MQPELLNVYREVLGREGVSGVSARHLIWWGKPFSLWEAELLMGVGRAPLSISLLPFLSVLPLPGLHLLLE